MTSKPALSAVCECLCTTHCQMELLSGNKIETEEIMELAYWHWLVFGMILIMLELFVPSFTIIWFGLGALLVGSILWILPDTSLTLQLLFWTLSSIAFTAFWFKVMKPRMVDKTKAGISREALLGECGQVIRVPGEDNRGTVRFSMPLLGSDEWSFICDSPVHIGDRVMVRDVSGNTLVVTLKGNN